MKATDLFKHAVIDHTNALARIHGLPSVSTNYRAYPEVDIMDEADSLSTDQDFLNNVADDCLVDYLFDKLVKTKDYESIADFINSHTAEYVGKAFQEAIFQIALREVEAKYND